MQVFQDFNSRAEEVDGMITISQISFFIGFGDRDLNCVFSDGVDIAMVE